MTAQRFKGVMMGDKCKAKHCKVQVSDYDWKCPKCGVTPEHNSGGFVIEEPDPNSEDLCLLLHENDMLSCHNCMYETTGKSYSAWFEKESKKIKCPHCNGTGKIDAPKKG